MKTTDVAGALAWGAAALAHLPDGDAQREARLLLGHATAVGQARLFAEPARPLAEAERRRYAAFVRRRAGREPLALISGRREFWTLTLEVTGDTLVPRPDSETLVEAAIAAAGSAPPRNILDLGTGSGCLLLALLAAFPMAEGIGVDISPAALAVAARNARRAGLCQRARFLASNWGDGLDACFDMILCNPPYVAHAAIDGLEPEVARFEPRRALDGGDDGLAAYRALLPRLARHLGKNGLAFVEIGAGQAAAVTALAAGARLRPIGRHRDLAGIDRCLIFGDHGKSRPTNKKPWKIAKAALVS